MITTCSDLRAVLYDRCGHEELGLTHRHRLGCLLAHRLEHVLVAQLASKQLSRTILHICRAAPPYACLPSHQAATNASPAPSCPPVHSRPHVQLP